MGPERKLIPSFEGANMTGELGRFLALVLFMARQRHKVHVFLIAIGALEGFLL